MARLIKKTYENQSCFLDVTNLRKRIFHVVLVDETKSIEPSDDVSLIKIHLINGEADISQISVSGVSEKQCRDAMELVLEFLHENDMKVAQVCLQANIKDGYMVTTDGFLISKHQYEEMRVSGLDVVIKANGMYDSNVDDMPEVAFSGVENETLQYGQHNLFKKESFKFNVSAPPQLRNAIIIINSGDDGTPYTGIEVDIELCFSKKTYVTSKLALLLPRFVVAGDQKISQLNLSFIKGALPRSMDYDHFKTIKDNGGFDLSNVPDNVRILTINNDLPDALLMSSNAIIESLKSLPNKDILFDVRLNPNHNFIRLMFRFLKFREAYKDRSTDDQEFDQVILEYLKGKGADKQRVSEILSSDYVKASDILWLNTFRSLKDILER